MARSDSVISGHHALGGEGQPLTRKRSSYHLTNSQAAVELFLRLNHARQTLEFVKRQTTAFAALDKAELSMWEALHLLDELREYETPLMSGAAEEAGAAATAPTPCPAGRLAGPAAAAPSAPPAACGSGAPQAAPSLAAAAGPEAPAPAAASMSLLEHALETAELCRAHHPDKDWLALVGLVHDLGKLLAHRRFGAQPQWAVCGETFPVGCRFSPAIMGAQYFSANPDRRRRLYNTPLGVYSPGCGLANVYMSWGAPEYLYLVLELNRVALPAEAMFVIRNHKFAALTRPSPPGGPASCYLPLCSAEDRALLPLLRSFQDLCAWRPAGRAAAWPAGFTPLQGEALMQHYSGLLDKYIGPGKLLW